MFNNLQLCSFRLLCFHLHSSQYHELGFYPILVIYLYFISILTIVCACQRTFKFQYPYYIIYNGDKQCLIIVVRAFTPAFPNCIKHPNIVKISENCTTPASPNEWNTYEDEQSLHKLEEQLFIRLTIKQSYFLSLTFCLPRQE